MKKLLLPFILILVITISGCSYNSKDTTSNIFNESKNISLQSDNASQISENECSEISSNEQLYTVEKSDVSNIAFMVEEKKYSTSVKKITYTITNNSQSIYSFPVYNISLEKQNSGEWITIPVKDDYVFMTLERVLQPGETASRTLDLEKIFHLPLEKGIYRFTKGNLQSEQFEIK